MYIPSLEVHFLKVKISTLFPARTTALTTNRGRSFPALEQQPSSSPPPTPCRLHILYAHCWAMQCFCTHVLCSDEPRDLARHSVVEIAVVWYLVTLAFTCSGHVHVLWER